MLGIMGIGSAFINAAGRGGKKAKMSIVAKTDEGDITLSQISCSGTIVVESIKNGEQLSVSYSNLNHAVMNIQNDANTDIKIIGDVTSFYFQSSFVSFVVTNANPLEELWCSVDSEDLEQFSISGAFNIKELKGLSTIKTDVYKNGLIALINNSLVTNGDVYYGITNEKTQAVLDASTAKGWTNHYDD